jgi:Tic22-like family
MNALVFLIVADISTSGSLAWLMNGNSRGPCVGPLFQSRHSCQFTSGNRQQQLHHGDKERGVVVEPVSNSFKESSSRIRSTHRKDTTIISRRNALQQTTTTGLLAVSTIVSFDTIFPTIAAISDAQEENNKGNATTSEGVSTEQLAGLLRVIPTFTIVDRQGIPYMVVGEDAKITCYFFIKYSEAQRLLDLARTSAEKVIRAARKEAASEKKKIDPQDLINPWKAARISTVPLDFAATLVTKSVSGGQSSRARGFGGNYFKIAASEDDIQNALSIAGKDSLSEDKVPLFYMEDFTVPVASGKQDKEEIKKTPLYFSRGQLEQDYTRLSSKTTTGGGELPEIKVTELFAVLVEMVSSSAGNDPELQNLFFVPPMDSSQRAKECIQKGGKEFPPFVLGQRNVIL